MKRIYVEAIIAGILFLWSLYNVVIGNMMWN